MQSNFPQALQRILVYEGGKVDDPRDPGGRTNKGITQATFNSWNRSKGAPQTDVYLISDADVAAIYKARYWDVVHGDDLPAGVDLAVFDAAVNSGPGAAGKWLQQALAAKGGVFTASIDGMIGPRTLQAVEDYKDFEDLVNAVCARRLGTLEHLSTWRTFGHGWAARIANVQKTGDAWTSGASAPHPVDVSPMGGHQKASLAAIKPSPISQGAAHATTAATTAGAVAVHLTTNLGPVQQAFPEAKWITAVMGALAGVSAVSGLFVKTMDDITRAASAGSRVALVDTDADVGFADVPIAKVG